MNKFEKKVLEFTEKNLNFLFLIVIIFFSFNIRFYGKSFISRDMKFCLIPWYETIKANGGILSLKYQVGDYNILYQTLIALFTYLPGKAIYKYKILSVIFDYLLAYICALFSCELIGKKKDKKVFTMVFILILFIPTIILNSAYWGQCDSIYTFFLVLVLYLMYNQRYSLAFVCLGVAFGCKLQAIFILPFIVCHYFYKKEYSIISFLLTILTFYSTGIFAILQGRNILDPIKIYINQSGTYKQMYLNVNSFWVLFGKDYRFSEVAIGITLLILGFGLYAVISGKVNIEKPEEYMGLASWTVWTMILFLPAMHERYTYLLDILLVILALIRTRYIKYAALSIVLSTMTYGYYLVGGTITQWTAFLYVAAWVHFTCIYFKENYNKGEEYMIFK